jgi:hypothetical protein
MSADLEDVRCNVYVLARSVESDSTHLGPFWPSADLCGILLYPAGVRR